VFQIELKSHEPEVHIKKHLVIIRKTSSDIMSIYMSIIRIFITCR